MTTLFSLPGTSARAVTDVVNDHFVGPDLIHDQIVADRKPPKERTTRCFSHVRVSRDSARRLRYERQGELPPPDCPPLYRQESLQDRRARRVRTEASCTPIAVEQFLDIFIGRQVSTSRPLFDDLPLFFGKTVFRAQPFYFPDQAGDLLLVSRRPAQYPIKNLAYLIFSHGAL
jgi:hypothetical protein